MASHAWFKVRKDGPQYRIMESKGPAGYQTVATSDSRIKANMSAGMRSSARVIKQRGRKVP